MSHEAGKCWVCNDPAFACVNGAWFCQEHQADVLLLQLEILAMESGAPLDLVHNLTMQALTELADPNSDISQSPAIIQRVDINMKDDPTPGSEAAIAAGCICAVLDNNHGKYPPFEPDGWWITMGCPVHASGKD